VQDLKNPDSECRIAIDVLVNFAAAAGPTGDNARAALCEVYSESIGPETRNALLNAAHEMTQQKFLEGDTANLSATVTFMAGVSSSPPDGKNGPGHIHAANALLAGKLGWPLDREPNLLADDRAITDVELLAEGANLENLNVWDRPISMDTPNAKEEFVALGHQALRHQKLATVWMPGNSGHHVAVVAEPVPNGIKFLVIAHPGDEHGRLVEEALKGLSSDSTTIVSRYEVEHPHLALEHLNDNVEDDRGAGGVIQEHADQWKNSSPEDQRAVTVANQAKLFEAVATSGSQSPAQVPPATPDVALPARLAPTKSLEDNFNTQGLTVHSGRVHSAFDAFAKIFSLKDAMLLAPKNPQLMASYLTTFHAQNDAPARGNFLRPALAFADGFNEGKAPLLFMNVDPSGPLASISKTLHGVGSGRKIIDLMVKHQQTLLQECRDAKDLLQLKKKLEEVVEVQAMLLGGIDAAIAELGKFESEDLRSLTPELAAQAKAQAKDLLAVSKRYRECLTGENSAGGNVYADFVAFAKQAIENSPNLERAQELFRGIGREPRTVSTPAGAMKPPTLPSSAVPPPTPAAAGAAADVPAGVSTPANLQGTPADLKSLALAAGFNAQKSAWHELSDTMQAHMDALAKAVPKERQAASEHVKRRLAEVPESHKRVATALIALNATPTKLARSALWPQLDKVRQANRLQAAKELAKLSPEEQAVTHQLAGPSILETKGLAMIAFPAQFNVRLKMLYLEMAKHAAKVNPSDPEDGALKQFNLALREAEGYLKRLDDWVQAGIEELNSVIDSKAPRWTVTPSMKADATAIKGALLGFQTEFRDPKGTTQQSVNFLQTALASADNLKGAAAAVKTLMPI
jgi:hypothetical protein